MTNDLQRQRYTEAMAWLRAYAGSDAFLVDLKRTLDDGEALSHRQVEAVMRNAARAPLDTGNDERPANDLDRRYGTDADYDYDRAEPFRDRWNRVPASRRTVLIEEFRGAGSVAVSGGIGIVHVCPDGTVKDGDEPCFDH